MASVTRRALNLKLVFIGLFLILLLVRLPFYFTHHIQEDAYITLRCAQNLAQTGVYGYNAGEKVSASTSHLYVFIAAIIRIIAGEDAFIPAIQVVNTIFFIAGAWFFARIFGKSAKVRFLLWSIISLLPISLMISYSGMETSLLIFIIGLTLYLVNKQKHLWLELLCIALLPWIRPDAIAYALIILFWESVRRKNFDFPLLGASVLGGVALLLYNQFYFGSILNQSIIAKAQTRHVFSLGELINNLKSIFISQGGGIFAPIHTKYFEPLWGFFLGVIIISVVYYLIRYRRNGPFFFKGLSIACMALLVPVAYAAGGVIYQWYFWPAAFLGYSILCSLLVEWMAAGSWVSKVLNGVVVLSLAAGIIAQWVFSYSWGMKEYAYRGGIGRQLAEISLKGDTLFLEPAGYIPFYSGLYTYDEAGLGSPLVVHFRQLYQTQWWIRFVEQAKPDWIVQRGHFSTFTTYQGYTLIKDDQLWFNENYHLVELKTFRPQDYATNPFLARLLRLGTADDYYIFEINR